MCMETLVDGRCENRYLWTGVAPEDRLSYQNVTRLVNVTDGYIVKLVVTDQQWCSSPNWFSATGLLQAVNGAGVIKTIYDRLLISVEK